MDIIDCIFKRLCYVKVIVDGIEFVSFNMYILCDKGYVKKQLYEYVVLS